MWTELYFWFNAVAYLGLGLWCAIAVDKTAGSLGYVGLNASGRCEYTAVYGGLQFGLGILFGFFALHAALQAMGLVFSLAIYSGIVIFRVIGLMRFWPVASATLAFAGLELAMLIAAAALHEMSGATATP